MFLISKINKSDANFYSLLGPVFGSRAIAKEVGIHCYADTGKQFYIAMVDDQLVGLLSKHKGVISDCYVYPNYRRLGILNELLQKALDGGSYKATCTELSRGVFERNGFVAKQKTKNFTIMELNNA